MISGSRVEEFLLCIEEQRYYDAHEVLEEVWFPLRFKECNEVKLIKGFINASVSFELHKRGRIEQSKKVWGNYLRYRALLYKLDSPNQNTYYQLSRRLETINHNKASIIKIV